MGAIDKLKQLAESLGVKVNPKLVKLPIYDKESVNSFQRFLIKERLRPILKLKLLSDLDTQFVIGYSEVEQALYGDGDEPPVEVRKYGPTIIKHKFEASEIFKYILQKLQIAVILIKIPANLDYKRLSDTEYDKWGSESLKAETFLSKDFVISEDFVLVPKEMEQKVKDIFSYYRPIFDEFVAECKDETLVPHDIYIEWLIKWFPGKVHVKSIE